jgi:hypothetical protein
LSDLTPVSSANARFKGIGKDGSYVYFSSEGVQSGSQANQLGETAQDGEPNLYVEHDGTITFVVKATLMVPPLNGGQTDAISQNGAFLAFNSTNNLTGYDNHGNYEIYLYSAAASRFECASCNPSGEAPAAGGGVLGNVPHEVSNNGQVFFESKETLLPKDINGQPNVYEFDYGNGVYLISTGTGSRMSILLDASVSGNDVFFLTSQSLVPQDSFPETEKIYDARVDGGFPEAASPPMCTTAEACRSAASPQPSIFGAPSSQTFIGPGNLTPLASPPEAKPKSKPTPTRSSCKRLRNKRRRATCQAKHGKHGNRKREAKSHKGGK